VIGVHNEVPVYAYGAPADMRKGFEGLSGLVRAEMAQDPLSGALYLFTNRRRTHAKVLHFDGTGLCVYAKRLSRGQFAKLWREPGAPTVELTRIELALFLEGSELVGRMKLSKPHLTKNELAISSQI
jgi:transposase